MKKLTLQYVKEFVKLKHNGECLSEEYIDSTKPLIFKCEHGHTWKATFSNIYHGSRWCKRCADNRMRSTLEDCHKVAQLHNGKCLSETYKDSRTNLKWECEFGHIFFRDYHHVKCRNQWCSDSMCRLSKQKQTMIQRFGVDNPQKSKFLKDKTKQTLLKKYGVEHPLQYKEFADKAARKINNPSILYHWKTNQEIICQGSYEQKVVQYLNQNKIDFDWQISFTLPNGKIYIADLYLKDQNMYIEIKGYFRKDAWEKWNLFLSMHPSSQLWDRKRLTELEIL